VAGTRRYPSNGRFIDFKKGINVVDTLLKNDFAQKLENYEYVNGTLRRRQPFVEKSTIDWSLGADYGSGAEIPLEFVGRHEYIDDTDTSRILHAHTNGSIKEFVSSGSSVNRVTGLTVDQKIRFENFMGACVSVNGYDTPRRADGTTWRTLGAPAPVVQAAATLGAGSLTVTRKAVVVACIRVSGVVAVRSDWSNTIQAAPSGQGITWNWAASTDARVDYYEVYVSQSGLSGPFFLLGGTTSNSLADNTADVDLSEQIVDSQYRNCPNPISKTVASAGQRLCFGGLVDATDPDADKTVHVSVSAINKYEIEYCPLDGIHKFKLPGAGPLTANIGLGNKDERDNANDVFFSQKDSCYILRGADPFTKLETVSTQVGAINPDAVAPWKRFLFFVSVQGLEFLGPTGSPINISKNVQPFFKGGGELNLGGIQGDQYVYLTVDNLKNQLHICFRDNTGVRWGNATLVLDLDAFDPYSARPETTARFTTSDGPGMAFYLSLRDRTLLLFDNVNYRMLVRGTGANDMIAGVSTAIDDNVWSGHLLGEYPDFRKKLCGVAVIAISDADASLSIERDYGYSAETKTVNQVIATRSWDKAWDKTWYASTFFQAYVPTNSVGVVFQNKLRVHNNSATYTFIGMILFYTQVQSKILGPR
jgi:hypothetical protein